MVKINLARVRVRSRRVQRRIRKLLWLMLRTCAFLLFCVSLFLGISLAIIATTESGAKFVWNLVKTNLDIIDGEYVSGTVVKGLTLDNFVLKIPDVIELSMDRADVKYNLLTLFSGDFHVSNVEAENLLIVIGGRPASLSSLEDFLANRLYEVKSYVKKNDDDLSLTRIRPEKEDPTTDIAPVFSDEYYNTEVVAEEPQEEAPYDSDIFPFPSLPFEITVDKIAVHNFLLLSEVIDVAFEEADLKAKYSNGVIDVSPSRVSFTDVQLHNERNGREQASNNKETKDSNTESAKVKEHSSKDENSKSQENVAENTVATNSKDLALEHKQNDTTEQAEANQNSNSKETSKLPNANLTKDSENFEKQTTSSKTSKHDPFDPKYIAEHIEKLPAVIMPFTVNVQNLFIENVRYHQDGYDTGVMLGELVGRYEKSLITVKKLKVVHELGTAQLDDSSMDLFNYYDISANLTAKSDNKEWFDLLHTHSLDAKVNGSLVDLSSTIKIIGSTDLKISSRISPLGDGLPFTVDLNGKNLHWPIQKPDYVVNKLNFNANGSLDLMDIETALTDVSITNMESFNITGDFTTDLKRVYFRDLAVKTKNQDSADVKGYFYFDEFIGFIGDIKANVSNLERYVEGVTGRLLVNITPNMQYKDMDNWKVDFNKLYMNGDINEIPMIVNKDVLSVTMRNKKLSGNVRNLNIINGANRIFVNGKFDNDLNLDIQLALTNLKEFNVDGLNGSANLSLLVSGTLDQPHISGVVTSDYVKYDTHRIANTEISLDTTLNKNMEIKDVSLTALVKSYRNNREQVAHHISLDIKGNEAEHIVDLATRFVNGGRLKLNLNGGLSNNRTNYKGTLAHLTMAGVGINVELLDPLNFDINFAQSLVVKLLKHSWFINGNSIDISDGIYSDKDASLQLVANNFDIMKFKRFLPNDFMIKKTIDISLVVANNDQKKPKVSLNIDSQDNLISYQKKSLYLKNFLITTLLEELKANATINLNLGDYGTIATNINITDPKNSKKLSGDIEIDNLSMQIIDMFSVQVSAAKGFVNGKATFAGTLEHPELLGCIKLNDSTIHTVMDIGVIEGINTTINFLGKGANMFSNFNISGVPASIDGHVDWDPKIEALAHISTQDLPINLLGYGTGKLSANLTSSYKNDVAYVSGDVGIPFARIKVNKLPASSVSVSNDVVELDLNSDGTYRAEKVEPMNAALKVKVSIGPDFKINAFGFKSFIKGDLFIKQEPKSDMKIFGNLDFENGSFRAYGQNLLIEEGFVSFVGDSSNPYLDFRAIRDPQTMEDDSIKAGLNVSGLATNPKIEIFTKPAKSQSESLSYLLRGRGLEEENSDSSNMSSQLLLNLGLMQTSGLVSEIGEGIGVEDLSLDSKNSGDSTTIELSAYIMPKVQVAYGYGIYNALSEFRLRYEMFPRFFIQGVSSVEQSVDAIYKFEFDF